MTASHGHHAHEHRQQATAPEPTERADLDVSGMTCTACAARIEKRLGAEPGVESAAVNFATKTASVRYDPARVGPASLVEAVRGLGYEARVPQAHTGAHDDHVQGHSEAGEERALLLRVVIGAALAAPVVAIAMSHGAWLDGAAGVAPRDPAVQPVLGMLERAGCPRESFADRLAM